MKVDLAAGFDPGSREEWRALALGVLRKSGYEGDDPEGRLATRLYDGVTIAPLYDTLPDTPRLVGRAGAWDVRQRHAHPDARVTREAVLADLENGVSSIWLDLTMLDPADLPVALDGVLLDLAPVVLDAGDRAAPAAHAFLQLAENVELPGGNLGFAPGDPDLADFAGRAHGRVKLVVVDALAWHDRGAADAQELAASLAQGVEALRRLTEAGLPVERAFELIEFRYAATADQFLTIAKLRAARRLWARIAEVAGGPPTQAQHAVTSGAMMTARDPWVNMLRTTLACFAAGAGGADAVTVQPFDAALGLPDAFARRIARNTQSLLVEEAGVARVADPAGGSWYVEQLTDDLANTAWDLFRQAEKHGGSVIEEGVAATRDRRAADVARRKWPITGVSEFPNLAERLPVREPGHGLAGEPARHAEPYERLRDLADRQESRPTVFLATLGPIAVHTARAGFAANLFAAGGIGTVSGEVADFDPSLTPVVCICSSDRLYADQAAQAAAALREAGAAKVWLAGKGEYEGVDATLFAGCDALKVLETTFDDLGVDR
ncbi:methylmalonyl-CoA mutase [Herbidospora sp. NEAU-GS84]|uniref:methylmalonyl-CoA mutase n=1 Tax=Herbidospora solisilvae TaxID=2696284 RepID=A0A7C9J0M2_9ACTN|nr:methylmalonyl-CoA mutase subunit beta [Herbidospora solisilvae]NAS20845.1 methylmalonyl-CoA mutase [Herbidospora solisilvae]